MEQKEATEIESILKVTPPELEEFSTLLEREAYRKKLVRKNGSWNQLEKVIWRPKFELEDFNVPSKEVQLPRVHSEPSMKTGVCLQSEERERLLRGTKRVREGASSSSMIVEERSVNSSVRGLDLDLNKTIEESFNSN